MPGFSNILCPVDLEQNALAAVNLASQLARDHKATLHLLHVLDLVEKTPSFGEIESAARTGLERIGRQKVKAGTRYDLLVTMGDPAAEILEAATRLGADLIIMATHGRRGLRRLVLGSVAERVVREARCPVLTVRPTAAGASRTRPKRPDQK